MRGRTGFPVRFGEVRAVGQKQSDDMATTNIYYRTAQHIYMRAARVTRRIRAKGWNYKAIELTASQLMHAHVTSNTIANYMANCIDVDKAKDIANDMANNTAKVTTKTIPYLIAVTQ